MYMTCVNHFRYHKCVCVSAGIIEVVCGVFMEAAAVYVEKEERCGVKSCCALLLSLLDIIHCLLKHLSAVVRLALQVRACACQSLTHAFTLAHDFFLSSL